jgi:hypothetical protein
MSNKLNLSIDQGTDFLRTLTLKSDANTTIDLTDYEFRGQAREAYDSKNAAFSFSFSIKNQGTNQGEVDMTLANAVSTALKLSAATEYYYDVEMVDAGSKVTRILEGVVTMNPEVTKA